MSAPAADLVDAPGKIERRGVDFIPDEERNSNALNVFSVFFGGNFSLVVVVFGWMPIALGLGFWSGVTAMLAGLGVGVLAMAPMVLFAPRTGTNNAISSGAHFGIMGRTIGSALALVASILFVAITIWTSGDALVAAADRLLGLGANDPMYLLVYALVAAGIVVVAVFGHGTIVFLAQRVAVPVCGLALLLGFAAYAGDFHPGDYEPAGYALGSFWPTWVLAASLVASGPVSYMPIVGDYARYVSSRRTSDARLLVAIGAGTFLGCLVPISFGLFAASTWADPAVGLVPGLMDGSPGWFVVAILTLALAGAIGQGTLSLYSTGLDLEALVPFLARVPASVATGTASLGLVVLGTLVFDAVDSISAVVSLLISMIVPWAAIMIAGLVLVRGRYDTVELQAYAERRRGGLYWFRGGWNPSATIAWALGAAVGLLACATSLYTGPIAARLSGVDVSFVLAGAVGLVAYLVLLRLRPQDRTPAAS